jgi:tRNA A-37 threonylcarbamoyl transferase component Bud32/tetratricopeptide (TPR) repeat protein
VVRPLGRGGMGQVFLGRDPKLERSVALKLLNADRPDTRGLFESEAKALAALSHPNIVTIFEIAEHEGRQFIAMEYLPGKSLRELLLHAKPSREALLGICAQVALALAAAHAAKILHRDIKPENVVVGDDGTVKVVDFGIARRLDRSSMVKIPTTQGAVARAVEIVDAFTQTIRIHGDTLDTTAPQLTAATHTICGTPGYMAPEVLMGEPSTPASDVYSLGVLLYECLTGKRPYDAPELHVVIARVIDGDEHPARLDDPLGELVEQMLDRDPAKRPGPEVIAKRLARRPATVASHARPRRWLVPVAAIALAGAGIGIWRARAGDPATAAVDREVVAVPIIAIESLTYAPNPPIDETTIARLIVELLQNAGVRAVGPEAMRPSDPKDPEAWNRAARSLQATRIVRGTIVEKGGRLVAELRLEDLEHRLPSQPLAGSAELATIAPLLVTIAQHIATAVKPGARVELDRSHAAKSVEAGVRKLEDTDFLSARVYLEHAVAHDPGFGKAWEQLSNALSRGGQRALSTIAMQRAVETSPEGPHRRILHAGLAINEARYRAVLADLESIDVGSLSKSDQIDRLFLMGEAHWHEGRHDRGFELFKQVLDLDPKDLRGASHAGEYAIARRLEEPGRHYLKLQRLGNGHIDFAMRRYDQLVRDGELPFSNWARIVLGDPKADVPTQKPPTMMTNERIALHDGSDRAALSRDARAVIETARSRDLTDVVVSDLVLATEVVLVSGLVDETRDLLALLAKLAPRSYNRHRLAILAGPLIGAPRFPRDELTERLARLADAVDAELAGDRARAAELLGALVDNPTWEWDYPERVALIRNLQALGRTKEVAAVCKATIEPAVMRYAYRAVRRICAELGVRRDRGSP